MVEPLTAREEEPAASQEGDLSARVGTVINEKWRLDALIGAGGMAAVYAATHRNGQRAALKVLHSTLAHDDAIRTRFLREGYVANSVNHPTCVAVLDDDSTDDGAPFLVMELLEGETLGRLWKRRGKKMPVLEALQLSDPVLDCLAACHKAGVIHRDLKPPNIFITHDGVVKVLDFGVAQMRDATAERTRAGTALGTPHYMSPEQAMGLVDQLDGRADIFSIGAILHALVTGQRIHTARTENEALILAATTAVPSVARIAADLPLEVIALIDKALCWDRRSRFADAREMQRAVRDASAMLGAPFDDAGPSSSRARSVSIAQPQTEPEPELLEDDASLLDELADENDPRVQRTRDLFKHVDRLLPTVRQLGWVHPATERALRTAHEAFAEALHADPQGLSVTILPYSFLVLGHTAWEPVPPSDTVPYNLFACGMRSLRFKPGLTLDELRTTLTLLLVDPGKDLPPEDDIAAALWDLGLAHVEYQTTDAFAEGDALEREGFFNETDDLERAAADASAAHLNRLETKAMAVSTDRAALATDRAPSPLDVDEAVKRAISTQLDLSSEAWSERYIDVVCDGLSDAALRGDVSIVLQSLSMSSTDLVVAGRLDVALTLHGELSRKLEARKAKESAKLISQLAGAMFGGDTLALTLTKLQASPDMIERFRPVLLRLSADELHVATTALREPYAEPLHKMLLAFVERCIPGNEEALLDLLADLDTAIVFPILAMLARTIGPDAKNVLAQFAASKDLGIRIEAQVLAAGNADAMQAELAKLCADGALGVRVTTLRAIARHNVKRLLPHVVRQVQSQGFNVMEPEERRELLTTLLALDPTRGEGLVLDVAKKTGLFASEAREASRVAAIETLAAVSASPDIASALRGIAQARWGTQDETRRAAQTASDQIEARLAAAAPQGKGVP